MSEVRRIVLSADPETYAKLEAMANGPRFNGNRSRAMSWSIALADAVMSDPVVKMQLFENPTAMLEAYRLGTLPELANVRRKAR